MKISIPILPIMLCPILLITPFAKAEEAQPVELRPVADGAYSEASAAGTFVIQSEEEWTIWWTSNIESDAAPPKIDFDKETIVAATMGERNTGGYAIEFTEATLSNNTISITVNTISPNPNDPVTMALTYPYTIAAIPKHEGEIIFKENSGQE